MVNLCAGQYQHHLYRFGYVPGRNHHARHHQQQRNRSRQEIYICHTHVPLNHQSLMTKSFAVCK